MISVQNLHFSYREEQNYREVLHNIDLTIDEGEWVTILGKNGSGKTTLAMCLNGLLLPGRGSVTVNGYQTGNEEEVYKIRQIVSYDFQNPDNQIIGATVEEDVAFGPENLGLPPQEIRRRVESSLAAVDMTAQRDRAPHLLSGGQKQKVAVAGGLAMEPRYMILDEATSMLDPKSRSELKQAIDALHRERNLAIINISHFPEEMLWGDRILVMDKGQIVLDRPKDELFQNIEELEACGIDLPEIPALSRELQRRGLPLRGGATTAQELVNAIWP